MVNPNFCKSEGNVQRLAFKTFLVSLFQASKNQRSLSYPVRQPPLSLPDPLSCASECIKMEKQQAGSCNALIFDRFCNSIFHINLYWWEKNSRQARLCHLGRASPPCNPSEPTINVFLVQTTSALSCSSTYSTLI